MKDKELRDFVLQSGLILGLVFGITTLLEYFLGVEILTSWWARVLTLILGIAGPAYFGIKWRDFKGGFIDMKETFTVIFSIYALSIFISTLFDYTLYNLIDTNLPDAILNEDLKSTVAFMEKMGLPEADIDKEIERIEELPKDYGIMALMMNYLFWLVVGGLVALISSAIVKKNPPIFDQE